MKKVIKTFKKMQEPDANAFWVSIIISIAAPLIGDIIAPLYFANFTNKMALNSSYEIVFTLVYVYCTCLLIKTVIWRIGNYFLVIVEQRTMHRIADHTAHHLLGLSIDFFKNHSSGGIVGKHNKFTRGYERMYDEVFFNLIPSIVIFVCIMPVLFIRMPLFGAGIMIAGILFVYMTYRFSKWIQPYNNNLSSVDTKVTSLISDQVNNINTIHAFGSIEEEKEYFSKYNTFRSEKRKVAWLKGFIQWSANDIFQAIMTIGSVFITLHLWHINVFTIGDVILVIAYTSTLAQRLSNMGNVIKNINQLMADAEEMIEILETKSSVQDVGTDTMHNKYGDIIFQNISFRYQENENAIFKNFNLTIPQGQKIGVVGESGSGKSTLIKILLREMDIDAGTLLVNDTEVKSISLRTLRNIIALVPQDPSLFHRTIHENIAYARPDASFEDVVEAAQKAQAHDFIMSLPKAYETKVGERGVKLSGGQRQRIAIARAFLADRPILIFDEATSALDSISETKIQKAMEEIKKSKNTMITIAHRLSTVAKMDRIIVFDNGVIIEDGTHCSLLQQNGLYTKLWNKQLLLEE